MRQYQITVSDIAIDVVHKKIKNVNLAVYSQDGRVRITAPLRVGGDAVREFALSKIQWIKNKQAKYQEQIRQTQRKYVSGEQRFKSYMDGFLPEWRIYKEELKLPY